MRSVAATHPWTRSHRNHAFALRARRQASRRCRRSAVTAGQPARRFHPRTRATTRSCVARYYDPGTGQFLTRDPLGAITGTPYAYAVNSPLNYTDPTGEHPIIAAAVIGGLIGGGSDFGIQMISNAMAGCDPFDINWGNVAESALIGGGLGAGGAWVASGKLGASLGRIRLADEIGAIGIPRAPSTITGYTSHGLHQAIGRDGGLGVAQHAILDAVRTRPIWQPATQTFKYVGQDATVFLKRSRACGDNMGPQQ